jgi:hypothetical protein
VIPSDGIYRVMETKPAWVKKRGRGAMAVGLFAAGAALIFFASKVRVPASQAGMVAVPEGKAAPGLVISRVDRLPAGGGLREQLSLLNPSPLYMPAADRPEGLSGLPERPGGRAAELFSPRFAYAERSPGSGILRPLSPGTASAAAEALAAPRWFSGIARSGELTALPSPPAARAALFTVYTLGASEAKAAFNLAADAVLGSVAWNPVEMTVVVNSVGAVSWPNMIASSGEERVDERVRELVGRDFLSKLSLRPGIYRIEVAP